MRWNIVTGCLNRDILIFAEIDACASLTEQLKLGSLVSCSRYGPVNLFIAAAATPSIVVVPSSAASTCYITQICYNKRHAGMQAYIIHTLSMLSLNFVTFVH